MGRDARAGAVRGGGGDALRTLFSGRDEHGRSVTGFADGDPLRPESLRYSDHPILEPGALGTFDDSGAMGSCMVTHEGRKHLYYIGWTRGVSVSFYTFIGCAVSNDGGETFDALPRHQYSSATSTIRT